MALSNMIKKGIILPKSVTDYWRTDRIWDRWFVEQEEISNRQTHIQQRTRTIEEVKSIPQTGLRVLDLCCGTGKVSNDLISLPNVAAVYAVDVNPETLAIMQERLSSNPNLHKLSILERDVMDPGGLSVVDKVDVVVCLDSLHHLWDLSRALSIIHDHLVPGGQFVGNCLAKENAAQHVGGKRGRAQFHFLYMRARFFIWLSFIPWLWEYSGRSGYVRLALVERDLLVRILNRDFVVKTMVSDDYHWFSVTKRQSS